MVLTFASVFSIQRVQVLLLDVFWNDVVPKWNHKQDEDGKEHLNDVDGRETEQAHDCQLAKLQQGELMDLPLWTSPDVMIWRVLVLRDD